jgi:ubiquinone/menaquinone biosynthesis C-methylase UbiE
MDGMPLDLADRRAVRAWNDEMVAKYDLERFHCHPSPLVRFVERRRVSRVLALLGARPGDRVLEVGCGAGHLLARVRAERSVGIDLSALVLRQARARVDGRAALVQGDAVELPFAAGAFDRAYCSEVLEHLADPRAALAEIRRVLRPRGVAVISVPNEALINRLKAGLRRAGLFDLLMRTRAGGYSVPERMDDEWHLHAFDLDLLRQVLPGGLVVARVAPVPAPGLPLRFVVRCEVQG